MDKKSTGFVNENEREEIMKLNDYKVSLEELLICVSDDIDSEFYQDIKEDLKNTQNSYNNWWTSMKEKYNWSTPHNGYYTIDFRTCEIFLYENKCSCCVK